MNKRRSPARDNPSQVPALPQLVPPWQHEETTPNRPHRPLPLGQSPRRQRQPHLPTSPDNNVSSSTTTNPQTGVSELEEGAEIAAAIQRRLEKLETRLASLEHELLGRQLSAEPVAAGKEEASVDRLQDDLTRLSSDLHLQLEQFQHRLSLSEHRSLTEEGRVTTLINSTQEIERGILEGQKQLLSRRDEQEKRLEELKERVHQLDQRQLQLVEYGRKSQESYGAQFGRAREEIRTMRGHVETLSASVGGRISRLEHGQGESLRAVKARVECVTAQTKKQMQMEVRGGLSDLHSQLAEVKREKEKQDIQLRESFMQIQSEMKQGVSSLQEQFTRGLRGNSANAKAQTLQAQDEVLSVTEYGRQECFRVRESLRRELEARMAVLEEAVESGREVYAASLNDMYSAVTADLEKTRTDLQQEIKAALHHGEKGREVLQGGLSVLEEEGRVTRRELRAVLEAEIKTRSQEMCQLQSEQEGLSRECRHHRNTMNTSLEAVQERARSDMEQFQLLRDALVREWQDVGVRLLSDVDTRLAAVHTHIDSLTDKGAVVGADAAGVKEATVSLEHDQWKDRVSRQMSLLQREQGELSRQVTVLSCAIEELQIKLVGAVQRETNQRFHAVLELKNELAQMSVRMPLPTGHPHSLHQDSLDTSHDSQFTPDLVELSHQEHQGQEQVSQKSQTPFSIASSIAFEGEDKGASTAPHNILECSGPESQESQASSSAHENQTPSPQSSGLASRGGTHGATACTSNQNPLHSKAQIHLPPPLAVAVAHSQNQPNSSKRCTDGKLGDIAEQVSEWAAAAERSGELPDRQQEGDENEEEAVARSETGGEEGGREVVVLEEGREREGEVTESGWRVEDVVQTHNTTHTALTVGHQSEASPQHGFGQNEDELNSSTDHAHIHTTDQTQQASEDTPLPADHDHTESEREHEQGGSALCHITGPEQTDDEEEATSDGPKVTWTIGEPHT